MPPKKKPEETSSRTAASYDYTAVPAPGAPSCPVCSNELKDGECPFCGASDRIQKAYLEMSELQARGIDVEDAAALLQTARDFLEEKDFAKAGEFLESARYFSAQAERAQAPLRRALDKAEGARKALQKSGKDTHRLGLALSRARRFLEEGNYEGARVLLKRTPALIRELQRPGPPQPEKPVAPPYLSCCPRCGKNVMKSWKKCPFCLAPLQSTISS